MSVDPSLLIAAVGGLASVGALAYQNRTKILALERWAWGEGKDETDGGAAEKTDSLTTQVNRIESKIDEQATERRRDHQHVEQEIRRTRRLVIDTTENMVEALNMDVDEADLDSSDVQPDWYEVLREEDRNDLVPDGDGGLQPSND